MAAKSKRQTSSKTKASSKRSSREEEKAEDVNYAKGADAFANDSSDEEEEEIPPHADNENSSEDEKDQVEDDDSEDSNDDDESSSEGDEDDDGNDDVAALFKGSAAAEEEDGSVVDTDKEKRDGTLIASTKRGPEHCNFDLRNMTAMNSHQVAASSLYQKSKRNEESITIPLEAGHSSVQMNEQYLLERASSGCTQLIAAIWQLPTETSDAGPLATLPGYDEIPLPRAMPPPPPKQETKWEKFAKAKGIPLNNEKRSRKVWDETTETWMYRHGYEKANSSSKEWPIMEVGATDDPYEDPWEKVRDAKRARTDKNLENRMKNQERVGNLAKGTTNRVLKSQERSRKAGKAGGNADRDNVLPTGVPVDINNNVAPSTGAKTLRGKASTTAALQAVQRSTASLGKFDKIIEGEPERKKTLSKMKKRKFESATDKKVITTEGQKSMKILNAVINGGGVAKEKAIRKGQYAKGETAYDYEFNDGLGASQFRKKKGRAGAGKMKKMTKKRTK